MLRRIRMIDHRVAIAVLACAMMLRVLIPAGWMPTTGSDGVFRISVCTGLGAQTVWMDRKGTVHKDEPASGQHDLQACGFGVLGLGLTVAPPIAPPIRALHMVDVTIAARQVLLIAHGLAAPPPPSTGPPSLI
jgi:hypothetical protein